MKTTYSYFPNGKEELSWTVVVGNGQAHGLIAVTNTESEAKLIVDALNNPVANNADRDIHNAILQALLYLVSHAETQNYKYKTNVLAIISEQLIKLRES